MQRFRLIGIVLALGLLAGCYPVRDTAHPPALRRLPATQTPHRLVIVLPGIADNLDSLEAGGIGTATRNAWPDADVLLVEMTIGYYKDGKAVQAIHDLVRDGHRRGYREVWLVGGSLGGMGALLYDATYPCDVDGILLLAPFLGDRQILGQVKDAGGLDHWSAPPAAMPGPDNWQAQIWRRAQEWSRHPGGDPRVWLAYGDRDKFARNMPLLAPAVPPSHIVTGAGIHEWSSWTPLAAKAIAAVDSQRDKSASSPRCAAPGSAM